MRHTQGDNTILKNEIVIMKCIIGLCTPVLMLVVLGAILIRMLPLTAILFFGFSDIPYAC